MRRPNRQDRTLVLLLSTVLLLKIAAGQCLQYPLLMIANFRFRWHLEGIRERSGYSSQELAINAGLPPAEGRRIQAGEIGLEYLTGARLAQVLRVSLAAIVTAAHALDPAMVRDRYGQMVARSRLPHQDRSDRRARSLRRNPHEH
jgi:hypothetical protein